jgi:phospholipid-translocating ATPase
MSFPHQYHKPNDSPYESEDDLDLDELDPASHVAQSRQPQASGKDRGLRDKAGIALSNLRTGDGRSARGRTTGTAKTNEDLEGLLQNGHIENYADDNPYTNGESSGDWYGRIGRRGRRRPQAKPTISRKSSIRASMQLPEFVRQELANMQEDPELSNKESREVTVGQMQKKKFPTNVVSNAKYTAWSFLPRTLYNEFSFFLNIYFLLVALSQIIPYLRIGYMSTYIVPLACVLTITIGKEAIDDIGRRRRDAEANAEYYDVLSFNMPLGGRHSMRAASPMPASDGIEIRKKARDLKVGDILKLQKNQRLPADVVILQSFPNDLTTPGDVSPAAQSVGETFIRTDQLDGETDWKLRIPSPLSQNLKRSDLRRLRISAGAPDKNVNEFVGTMELEPQQESAYDPHIGKDDVSNDAENDADANNGNDNTTPLPTSVPLTIDNTAWANTVLASNTVTLAAIIYTGRQTKFAMSTSPSRSKTGLLELEINNLTKILCAMTLTLSIILVALEGFEPSNKKPWYVAIMIYLILFSTIIPISLRVNLDTGKTVYAYFIEHDDGIPDTVVRTSTIPEDLGRIEYLLSDKTGTLTQNEMRLKKIHVGTVSYANDAMEEVASYVKQAFANLGQEVTADDALFEPSKMLALTNPGAATRTRREIGSRVRDLVLALALCHNVTPTADEVDGDKVITYQASSPDEIAIVEFTEAVGLRLMQRDRQSITLQAVDTGCVAVKVEIMDIFPFTSESKRMGVVVRFTSRVSEKAPESSDLWFYQKGADTVMSSIVATNDWLDEETANMAREGLRTLVIGRKKLSPQQYQAFSKSYKEASLVLQDRDADMAAVVKKHLEHDLELLGVTGVEDRLQKDVKSSLELLRNAGVKIWMLTGDKVETARCVAISARLVARGQHIETMAKLRHKTQGQEALDAMRNKTDSCLLIDGESLALMLTHFQTQFMSLAVLLPAVIACRCSPTQKSDVALLIRKHTKKRICCIGDGGNDVSMIQAADVGIGIVGKEGRQASLAADFSITQFCHLTKLLVWHGRNSYKRSAKLAQFIIHRGLIISVCQTMYNIAGHFDPKGLFKDWLLVGYATLYTSAPVFSLVYDRDVDEHLANLYPELYKELKTGKSLSYQTFFTWVGVSVYQGIIIQGLSQLLVGAVDGPRMLSVSFTVLVLNELIMVAVAVTTWHPTMIACILGTGAVYAASVPFLGDYFDLSYVVSWGWVWRVAAVAAISLVPVWGGNVIRRTWKPPSYRKVQGI